MRMIRPGLITALVFFGLALAACQKQHTMTKPEPGSTAICAKCYEHIQKWRKPGGPHGLGTNRTIATHMCEDCKSEVSIYSEDSVLMVKCAKCAPEGLPCDRCLPPEGSQ